MASNSSIIEGMLYLKGEEGVEISELKKILDIDSEEIKKTLVELTKKYIAEDSAFIVKNFGTKYFLLTKPEIKEFIIKQTNTVNKKTNAISKILLEILAIIAYNENCTKSKIAFVRDSDPELQLKKLQTLGLVELLDSSNTRFTKYLRFN